MVIGDCCICDKTLYDGDVAKHYAHTDIFICNSCFKQDQPERLSEKTYYRNDDGTYPHLEACIGSDSLNSMET
jgi:hypothetical protein